jgi:hypothetical protein
VTDGLAVTGGQVLALLTVLRAPTEPELGVDRPGAEKVPAADIPARLRTVAPDWAPYRTLTGRDIRDYLQAEHGVKVAITGHKYPVDPAAVRDALARRAATGGPDGAA